MDVQTTTLMILQFTVVSNNVALKVLTLQIWNLIDSSRIWESDLFTGMVRLQDGNFSNQGLVEIKCNSNWGTICSSGFDSSDAIAVCTQLGYTGYINYTQIKY